MFYSQHREKAFYSETTVSYMYLFYDPLQHKGFLVHWIRMRSNIIHVLKGEFFLFMLVYREFFTYSKLVF